MTAYRRKWLLSLLVLVALMLSLLPMAWAQSSFTLTILHTNDTHAHLESFQPFNQPLQGGVARRYTAIQQVRGEGRQHHPGGCG